MIFFRVRPRNTWYKYEHRQSQVRAFDALVFRELRQQNLGGDRSRGVLLGSVRLVLTPVCVLGRFVCQDFGNKIGFVGSSRGWDRGSSENVFEFSDLESFAKQ
jgi:hypothetical protein